MQRTGNFHVVVETDGQYSPGMQETEMSWVTRYVTQVTERDVAGNHTWSRIAKYSTMAEGLTKLSQVPTS